MVRRDDDVLHLELYLNGALQEKVPIRQCADQRNFNGVVHLFRKALAMPLPSDATTDQVVLLGATDATGETGSSPANIEYRQVRYFHDSLATLLPSIVAVPDTAMVQLHQWEHESKACNMIHGYAFIMNDAVKRTGACITLLEKTTPTCSVMQNFTDTDGYNKQIQSCTKAMVLRLNEGEQYLVGRESGGFTVEEWQPIVGLRGSGNAEYAYLKGEDFSKAWTFYARLSKTVVCTTFEGSSSCSVAKEGICVQCPYPAEYSFTMFTGKYTYQKHCATATTKCEPGTNEHKKFTAILMAL